MSKVYLVRHGQASAGTDDYDRLSSLGEKQSQLLGQWWHSQGFSPDIACHGTLKRQRDTAHLALAGHTPLRTPDEHEGLNEYDHRIVDSHFGHGCQSDNPESLSFEGYVDIMQRWRDHVAQPDLPQIESWTEFARRGWDTIKEQHHTHSEKRHHVFFTSGGVIATILSTVLNLDFAHTVDAIWRIRNASITTLNFDGTHARLIDFNTVPHLQAQNDPSLITLI